MEKNGTHVEGWSLSYFGGGLCQTFQDGTGVTIKAHVTADS